MTLRLLERHEHAQVCAKLISISFFFRQKCNSINLFVLIIYNYIAFVQITVISINQQRKITTNQCKFAINYYSCWWTFPLRNEKSFFNTFSTLELHLSIKLDFRFYDCSKDNEYIQVCQNEYSFLVRQKHNCINLFISTIFISVITRVI